MVRRQGTGSGLIIERELAKNEQEGLRRWADRWPRTDEPDESALAWESPAKATPAAGRPIAGTSDRCDMRTRVPLADDADTCPSDGVGKGSDHGQVNASSCPKASTDMRDTKG